MSHNIAVIAGQEAMAYQGMTPWHGLGKFMGNGARIDVQAAMIAANLDWKVDFKSHMVYDEASKSYVVNPFSKAVVRDIDNAIIGSVGAKTGLVQNREAFGILDPLIKDFGVTIETAGALGNGARVWMLAKMPEAIAPVPGDDINGYFLIIHAHDNTHSLDGIPTPIRVVCQNTLQMAVFDAGGLHTSAGRAFKIKKTKNVGARVDEAAKFMKTMAEAMGAANKNFADMAAMKLNPQMLAQYIESVLPLPKDVKTGKVMDSDTITARRKTIAELVFTGKGVEMAGSDLTTGNTTLWAAYNAITEYFDHVRPAEAKSDSAKAKANMSAIFGTNAATKLIALSKAQKLVAAA